MPYSPTMMYTQDMDKKTIIANWSPSFKNETDKAISEEARAWLERFAAVYKDLENNHLLTMNNLESCSDTFVNGKLAEFIKTVREAVSILK